MVLKTTAGILISAGARLGTIHNHVIVSVRFAGEAPSLKSCAFF